MRCGKSVGGAVWLISVGCVVSGVFAQSSGAGVAICYAPGTADDVIVKEAAGGQPSPEFVLNHRWPGEMGSAQALT